MLLDEANVVATLTKPLASLLVWIVQWYFAIVRYVYVGWNTLTQEKHVVTKPPADSLVLISAVELVKKIRNREITATNVIESYIQRIEVVDTRIHAVVQKNYDDARERAKEVDALLDSLDKNSEEYRKLIETKPLLGVPFSIKDQFLIKGLRTTVGMTCFRNMPLAEEDAEVVKNLREAGAIPLTVSNVPEGVMWGEGKLFSTNSIYPRTLNSYDSRCAPGGSSSGEGALLAAAASVIGVGTDIAGSIRLPAMLNGVFGLKPSPHLGSIKGMIPNQLHGYQNEMAALGPMTRYACDLMPFFKVLIGTENSKKLRLDDSVDVSKLRFYSMQSTGNRLLSPSLQPDVLGAFLKTINHFREFTEKEVVAVEFETAKYAANFWFASMTEAGGLSTGQFFGGFGTCEPVNFLRELPKWLRGKSEHTSAVMLALGIEEVSKFISIDRPAIESMRDQLRADIIELLSENGVLIFPSLPQSSYHHNEMLWNPFQGEYTAIWNALSLPAVSCPVGLNASGIPLGVQLVASPHNERLLIAAAVEIERAFGGYVLPPGQQE
ncbi:Fatty-acid amide hydrolase 2 [Aphelenchoides besseyi]|nr:Fatty-acid amide hydrolase 2 [Aphelenchoides besseyi]